MLQKNKHAFFQIVIILSVFIFENLEEKWDLRSYIPHAVLYMYLGPIPLLNLLMCYC